MSSLRPESENHSSILIQITNNSNAASNEISSPVQKLLDNFEILGNDSKKAIFQLVMNTNNEVLQCETIHLQESKMTYQKTLHAKLARELIAFAEKYKISELTFDTKATKP
jgi:16S rRNA G1207 methylase RsmC